MGTVVFRLEGDDAGAVSAFLRLTKAQREAELGAQKAAQASRKHTEESTRGSDEIVAGLRGQVSALGAITLAATGAAAAMRAFAEAKAKASESATATAAGIGKLAQIARDPEDLKRMEEEVRRSRVTTGMNAEQAGSLQFMLESLSVPGYRDRIARLQGMTNPTELIRGAKRLTESMGTPTLAAINRLFVASKESSTEVSELAAAVPEPAAMSKLIGSDDSELLGTLSVLGKQIGVDKAGTFVANIEKTINERGYGGHGLVAGVRKLAEELKGKTPQEIQAAIPEIRAFKGFSMITDKLPEIEAMTNKIREVGEAKAGESYMDNAISIYESNPILGGSRRKLAAAQAEEIANEERYATERMKGEARLHAARAYGLQHDTALQSAGRYFSNGVLLGVPDALSKIPLVGGLVPQPGLGFKESLERGISGFGQTAGGVSVMLPDRMNYSPENDWRFWKAAKPDPRYKGPRTPPSDQYTAPGSDSLEREFSPESIAGKVINNHFYYGDNYSLAQQRDIAKPDELGPTVGAD